MSNYTRAVAIIMKATKHPERAHDVVEELDNEGLIAPDLPEPNDPNVFVPNGKGWLPGGPHGVWAVPGGQVMVKRIGPAGLTPDEARELANALYAAADYAETDKRHPTIDAAHAMNGELK